jgi:hypothetical protein
MSQEPKLELDWTNFWSLGKTYLDIIINYLHDTNYSKCPILIYSMSDM